MKIRFYDTVVAVDPDVEKCGFAAYHRKDKKFTCGSMPFAQLLDLLRTGKKVADQDNKKMVVIIEGGWLETKSNHHFATNIRVAERIAKNVGANHQTGKLIREMCIHYEITCYIVKPLKLIWGKDRHSKITHEEFVKLTGYEKRVNQDARDAGLLCWINKEIIVNE